MTKLLMAMFIAGFASVAIAQDDLKVGDKAPDFEVESFNDVTVKLSDRFGEKGKPTILLFSRANW
jgi:peroxiredoxin